jgi:hypothetical protein
MRFSQIAFLCAGLAGCAEYIYRPSENATAEIRGHVAAKYDIPAQSPQGDVRIASFGFTKIQAENDPHTSHPAVHLRLIVANNSNELWTVDTRQIKIDFAGSAQSTAAFVTTREGDEGLPIVQIAPKGQRVIDLFYPLPASMPKASKLPEFDALWQVHAGNQVVTERTPFERLRIEPAYAYGYGPEWGWYGAWGGPYWYDPWYPAGVLPPTIVGGSVRIAAPHWEQREAVPEHHR